MGGKRYADTPREFGESKINLKKVLKEDLKMNVQK